MLRTLWTLYLILYLVLSSPFARISLVYFGCMMLPGILFVGWRMFEAMQAGCGFSTYHKVMGRWYFWSWAVLSVPCAVLANMSDQMLLVAFVSYLSVPTVIWFAMYHGVNILTMVTDYETYDYCHRNRVDVWTSCNDLNWENDH